VAHLIPAEPVDAVSSGTAPPHNALSFVVGEETYCIDMLRVQEIRG
jgi:chemotaxis signal transduction protein